MAIQITITDALGNETTRDVSPGDIINLDPGSKVELEGVEIGQPLKQGNSLMIHIPGGQVELTGFFQGDDAPVSSFTYTDPEGDTQTKLSSTDTSNDEDDEDDSQQSESDSYVGSGMGDSGLPENDDDTQQGKSEQLSGSGDGNDDDGEDASGFNRHSSSGKGSGSGDKEIFTESQDLGPVVFSISPASGREGNSITFTITRTDNTRGTDSIDFRSLVVAGDTATAVVDYTPDLGTLTFLPGETSRTITIQTISQPDDAEGNETFTVQLSNPTSSRANAEIIMEVTEVKGTIIDNNTPNIAADAIAATEQVTTGNLISTLLANDDPGTGDAATGDFNTITAVTAAVNGSVSFTGSSLTYTADNATHNALSQGDTTTDTFTYSIADEAGVAAGPATVTVTVTGVNDAPVIGGVTTVTAINDTQTATPFSAVTLVDVDTSTPQSQTVTVTIDSAAKGSFTTLNGFTDTGGGVYTLNAANVTAAQTAIRGLVFTPTANNVPAENTETSTFTININDGIASDVDATTTVVTTSLNDAPILTPATPALTATDENTTSAASTVASLLGANLNDADAGALEGIAITSITANGSWEFSINGGATFGAISPVDANNSLLLRATDLVRYVPDGANAETATFTFRGWDQTSGTAGSKVNTSANGDPTAFSTAIDTTSINVTAVNDAPIVDTNGPDPDTGINFAAGFTVGNGLQSIIDVDATVTDVDSATLSSIVITLTNHPDLDDGVGDGTELLHIDAATAAGQGVTIGGNDSDVITLSGAVSPTAYQTVLRTLQYNNTESDATVDATQRVVTVLADDGAGANNLSALATITVDISAAPVIANLAGDTAAFVEDTSGAVLLDVGGDATVNDADSADFDTGVLTATIIGGGDVAEDVLSFDTAGTVSLAGTTAGSNVLVGATVVGTLGSNIAAGNSLTVTLNASATPGLVQSLVRALQYDNTDVDDPTNTPRTVRVTVSDGDGAISSNNDVTVTVTRTNDEPIQTVTGNTDTYTENAAALTIANADYAIDTIEAGQTIETVTFRLTNIADTANEQLTFDGSTIALTNGGSGNTTGNTYAFTVVEAGGTATVTFTLAGQSVANTETRIKAATYQYDGEDITAGTARGVTVQVQDSGGTTPGDDLSTEATLNTITVQPVNDEPTQTVTANANTYTENAAALVIANADYAIDTIEALQTIETVTFRITNIADTANEQLTFDGSTIALTNGGSGNTATSNYAFTVVEVGGTATVTFTLAGQSVLNTEARIKAATYQYDGEDITAGTARGVTVQVQDSGGTTPGDDLSTEATLNTITVQPVNDEPTQTVTNNTDTYTENAAALTIANADYAIDTIEALQTIETVTFRITNIADTANEQLTFDGSTIALTNGGSGNTTGNTYAFAVVEAGGTATVTFTLAGQSVLNTEARIKAATYQYDGEDITAGTARGVTVQVQDNGGTTPGDDLSTEAPLNTITVQPVNDEPTQTVTGNTDTYTENAAALTIANADYAIDTIEALQTIETVTFRITNIADTANEQLTFDGSTIALTNGGSGNTATSNYAFTVAEAGGTATVTFTLAGQSVLNTEARIKAATYQYDGEDITAGTARGVTVQVQDNGGTTPGDDLSTEATLNTITVQPVNDEPTQTVTGNTDTYTENAAALTIANADYAIDTIEALQTIETVTFRLTNIADPANEQLTFDGSTIALTNGGSGNTTGNTYAFTVVEAGGTATVTFTLAGQSVANTEARIKAATYQYDGEDITAGTARGVTVQVQDNGGTTPGDDLSTEATLNTITVQPVNDNPIVDTNGPDPDTGINFAAGFTVGNGLQSIIDVDATVTDVDSATLSSIVITLTNHPDLDDGVGDGTELLHIDAATAAGQGVTIGGNDSDVITLSGAVSPTAYQTVLRTLQYNNTESDATVDATQRVVTVLADDGAGANNLSALATITVDISAAPVIANLAGDTAAFVEDTSGAVLLDVGGDATVNDADSADFDTGVLTATIIGGGDVAEDVLSFNTGGTVSLAGTTAGSNVLVGATVVGTLGSNIAAGNSLTVTLNASATPGLVQSLVRALQYDNTDVDDPTNTPRTVRVTVSDGDGAVSSNNDVTVTVTRTNDEPIQTVTGNTDTYTENAAALTIANADYAIDTIEALQTIETVTFRLTNIADTANEQLTFDGSTIALTNGGSGNTATSNYAFTVVEAGGTATVTFTLAGQSVANTETRIKAATYQYDGEDITAGTARGVTVQVQDSGGTTPGDDLSTEATLNTITVQPVNDEPTQTVTANANTYTENAAALVIANADYAIDTIEALQTIETVTFRLTNIADTANEQLTFDGSTIALTNGGSGNTATSNYAFTVVEAGGTATVTFTLAGQSVLNTETRIKAATYQYDGEDITAGTARGVTVQVQDNGGTTPGDDLSTEATLNTITVQPVNDEPTQTVTNNTDTYTENAAALTIANADYAIDTIEALQTIETVTFRLTNIADTANEQLTFDGSTIALTNGGSGNTTGNTYAFTVVEAGGTATVTFTLAGQSVLNTEARIKAATYQYDGEDITAGTARGVTVQVQDNGGTTPGDDLSTEATLNTITVQPVNDEPTQTVTGNTDTYTENAAALTIANADYAIDTIEALQTIETVTFRLTNIADTANEQLTFDGSTIALTNGGSGNTATSNYAFTVAEVGGTATVTFTLAGQSVLNTEARIKAATYQYDGEDITAGTARGVTVQVQDNGGTTPGDDLSTEATLNTITVQPVNDEPTQTVTGNTDTYTENAAALVIANADYAIDTIEALQTIETVTFRLTNIADPANEQLTFDGSTIALTNGGSGNTTGNTYAFTVVEAGGTATVTFTLAGQSVANTEARIKAATYQYDGEDITAGTARGVTVQVQDNGGTTPGDDLSTEATLNTITVQPVNDNPIVDTNGPDPDTGINFAAGFTVGNGLQSIIDVDATVTDVDSATLSSIVITLTNHPDLDDGVGDGTELLHIDAATAAGQGVTIGGNDSDVITLSGAVSPTAYQTVLRTLQYNNTESDATVDATQRVVTVLADDGAGANNLSALATITVDISAAPVIANLAGDTAAFVEDTSGAVLLDVGGDATVNDADSADFDTGVLTATIIGGGDVAEDVLSFNTGGTVSLAGTTAGSNVLVGATVVGTLGSNIAAGNSLTVTLNASATPGLVQSLVRALQYDNTDVDDPTNTPRTVRVTVSDGDGAVSSNNDVTVTVTRTNDEPIQTVTGNTDTYTENAAALTIANADYAIDTIEAGQTIETVTFRLTNIADTANEQLTFDGSTIALTNGGSGNTATSNYAFTVAEAGGTATVTFTLAGQSVANTETRIKAATYQYDGEDITAGTARGVTVQVQDSGGTTPGDDLSTEATLNTITVQPVNDEPTQTVTANANTYTENAAALVIANADYAIDTIEALQTIETVTFRLTNIADTANEQLTFDGSTIALTNGGSGNTATSNYAFTVVEAGGTATVTFTLAGQSVLNTETRIKAATYQYDGEDITAGTARGVTVQVQDNGGTTPGDDLSTEATLNTITVQPVNDEPTQTVTANANTYTENAAALTIANADYAIDTIEALQTIETVTFRITNIADTANEQLTFDGSTIALTNGGSGNTATSNYAFTVVEAGGTATVTFTLAGQSVLNTEARIKAATYQYDGEDITAGTARGVTVQVQDNGGTTPGDDLSTEATLNTITVQPVNDEPTQTVTGNTDTYTENAAALVIANADYAIDTIEALQTIETVTFRLTNIADTANEQLTFDGSTIALTNGGSGNTTGNTYAFAVVEAGGTATVTFTLAGQSVLNTEARIKAATYQYDGEDITAGTARGVTVQVQDNGGTTPGDDLSTEATLNTITVQPVNDEPTQTVTGNTDTYTENAAALVIANADYAIDTIEALQTIETVTFRLTNIADPANEQLTFDGSTIALTNGGSGNTTGNTYAFTVVEAGGTATVTFTLAGQSVANTEARIKAATYQYDGEDITAGTARGVTVQVQDNGGTTPGDDLSTEATLNTITVQPVNDNPIVDTNGPDPDTGINFAAGFTVGNGLQSIIDVDATVTDVDSATLSSIVITLTNHPDLDDGVGDGTELLHIDAATAAGQGVTIGGNDSDVITLSGAVSPTAYQTVLRTLQYNNTESDATVDATQRVVTVLADDGAGANNLSALATITVDIFAAPVIANLAGDTAAFVEDTSGAVLLDVGGDATVNDADSADFDTGVLTATIIGGGDVAEDVLSFNTGGTVSLAGTTAGSNVLVGATVVGTLGSNIAAGNSLTVTLNASATPGLVQSLVRALQYDNTDVDDPTNTPRTVRVTVSDGDGAVSSNNDVTVTVTRTNDEPIQTVTGNTDTYTENAAALTIANADYAIDTIEAGQTIETVTFRLTNIADTANEQLTFDGSTIALTNGGSGNTATSNYAFTVVEAGGTATVTFTLAGQSVLNTETRIKAATYQYDGEDITAGTARGVTVQVQDSGGTTPGDDLSTEATLNTITVQPVNDEPTQTVTANANTYTENAAALTIANADYAIDTIEALQTIETVTFRLTNIADTANEQLTFDGSTIALTNGGSGNTATSNYAFTVAEVGGTATVTFTLAGQSVLNTETRIKAATYQYDGEDITAGTARGVTVQVQDNGGTTPGDDLSTEATLNTITVQPVNDEPTQTVTGNTDTYTENAAALTIANADYAIDTIEALQTIETVTFRITNIADTANEQLTFDGSTIALTNGGSGNTTGNTYAFTVVEAGGTATVTFTLAGQSVLNTETRIKAATYQYDGEDISAGTARGVTVQVQDNGGTTPGDDLSTEATLNTITVQPVNDEPTQTVTGNTDTYTENAAALTIANADYAIDTIEALQTIETVTFRITNIADTANEQLTFDGSTIALTNGGSGNTTGNTYAFAVVEAGGTATVTFTLAGQSVLNTEARIKAATYQYDGEDITAGTARGVTVQVQDNGGTTPGDDLSTEATLNTITVAPVNDAPSISGTTTPPNATESAGATNAVALVTGAGVTDDDAANFNGGTITVDLDGFQAGDTLFLLNGNGQTGITSVTGGTASTPLVITLNTGATAAQTAILLDDLRFQNTGDDPTVADTDLDRAYTIVLNDGGNSPTPAENSNTLSGTLTLVGQNDPAAITSPTTVGTTVGAPVTFTAGTATEISLIDPDAGTDSIEVTLTSTQGVITLASTTGLTITDAQGDNSVVFTGSQSDVNTALNGLVYTTAVDDTINIDIDDQGNNGAALGGVQLSSASVTVDVSQRPIVDLNGADGGGINFSATFTEDVTPTVLVGDTDLTVSDADGDNIQGAIVSITGGTFVAGQDVLAVTDQFGITSSYNNGTGVLTLSNTRSAADYQTVLRTLTYDNTSDAPTTTARTIEVSVSDASGLSNSPSAISTITVVATNDAPVLNPAATPVLTAVDQDANIPDGAVGTAITELVDIGGVLSNVTDPDGTGLGIAITDLDETNGSWHFSVNGGTTWSSIGTGTVTGTNSLLLDSNSRIYFDPNGTFTGDITDAITFRAWDVTTGTASNTANTTISNGGSTAFSTAIDTADITVNVTALPISNLSMSALDGTDGLQINGKRGGSLGASDLLGTSVSGIGDVNGDGIDDVLLGANNAELSSDSISFNRGEGYVIFGNSTANLNTLANGTIGFALGLLNGTNGITITGPNINNALLGTTTGGGGDFNGDGLSDLLIGELNFLTGNSNGYVLYGDNATNGSSANDFGDLDGTIVSSLSGTADLNGDGLDDGAVFDGLVSTTFATSVSSAGDVNNDGIDDILVGNADRDTNGTNSGEAFLIFGDTSANIDALNPLGGANGSSVLAFEGNGAGIFAGRSVAGIGDINHDGFDDFAIGATAASTDGKVYVIMGDTQTNLANLSASIDSSGIETVLNGTNGFVLDSPLFEASGNMRAGESISGIGDFNGDMIDDFALTAAEFGLAYVVFGKQSSFASTVSLTDLAFNQNGGFGLAGGLSVVDGAGDVNGDGLSDLIFGTPGANDAYILFGTTNVTPLLSPVFGVNMIDLTFDGNLDGGGTQLLSGGTLFGAGVRLDGDFGTNTGTSVAGIGDFNNDGFDDVAIGATAAASTTSTGVPAGEVYIVYGKDFSSAGASSVTTTASANNQVLQGDLNTDELSSGGFTGVGMSAGSGNDVLRVNGFEFGVDGGGGIDILTPDTAGISLNFDALTNKNIYSEIEQIQLNGFGTNSLALDVRDVLDMSGGLNELLITGDGGGTPDIVQSAGQGWTTSSTDTRSVFIDDTGTNQSITFNVYTTNLAEATLLVQQDLNQTGIS